MNFINKDQLARYMISGHVHLSKKDYGFFNNVITQVQSNRQITSNQNNLFDKLLNKYKRQINKLNYDVENLISLEWKLGIVESKKEFLEARISIIDDEVIIKCPFNTQFVQKFRQLEINPFEWDSISKSYKGKLSTYSLKTAYSYLNKYYKDVVYCEHVKELLDQIENYSFVKFWQPTLVKIYNNFYIFAINESLADAISHLEINDDPKTLFSLSMYGITIDSSVINDDPLKNFASTRRFTFDLDNLDFIIKMLKSLEVDHVFTSRDVVYNKNISNEMRMKLLEQNITCSPKNADNIFERSILFTTSSVESFGKKVAKIVHITNSRPIKIR